MKKIISALLILTMLVSMVCVSASAQTYINNSFESMEGFTEQFIAGAFYTEDGLLYGYAEAKALQSKYNTSDEGWFENNGYTWLTYDCSITLTAADDDLSETDRFINLVYCNDNLQYMGRDEDRVMMAFMYDMQEGCFRFARGFNNTEAENQICDPVYREIDTDGKDDHTLGMSIQKNRIRCFYNDELIFDLNDTSESWLIAHYINSCFLFWQDGNFVQIKNIKVADAGDMFPTDIAPATTTTRETTTSQINVIITDEKGETVTDDKGEAVTSISIVTEAPGAANTNQGGNVNGSSSTGDIALVVVVAMVATLGCALIVKKVAVR